METTMHKGNRENRDYLSRRSLLQAIGVAGVAAPVLDPDPTLKNGDPIRKFYQDINSLNAFRSGFQEGHRSSEDDQKQGLPVSEQRVEEEELSEGRKGNREEELELHRYDHAA